MFSFSPKAIVFKFALTCYTRLERDYCDDCIINAHMLKPHDWLNMLTYSFLSLLTENDAKRVTGWMNFTMIVGTSSRTNTTRTLIPDDLHSLPQLMNRLFDDEEGPCQLPHSRNTVDPPLETTCIQMPPHRTPPPGFCAQSQTVTLKGRTPRRPPWAHGYRKGRPPPLPPDSPAVKFLPQVWSANLEDQTGPKAFTRVIVPSSSRSDFNGKWCNSWALFLPKCIL